MIQEYHNFILLKAFVLQLWKYASKLKGVPNIINLDLETLTFKTSTISQTSEHQVYHNKFITEVALLFFFLSYLMVPHFFKAQTHKGFPAQLQSIGRAPGVFHCLLTVICENYAYSHTQLSSLFGIFWLIELQGFPGSSAAKESACNSGNPGSVPVSGRFPGGGLGNPLQYSFLKNPMDRSSWRATVQGVTKSWTQFSNQTTIR